MTMELKNEPRNIPKCWVCGVPADSREHRFKKSDLVAVFGRGPYEREDAQFTHIDEDGKSAYKTIQGPNSDTLKYPRSLCRQCNNKLTQPYDRAYEKLQSWMRQNEAHLLNSRFLDFKEIYGATWSNDIDNLIRYFAKSLGCRICNDGQPVPQALVDAVRGSKKIYRYLVKFAVVEEFLHHQDAKGVIAKGDLLVVPSLEDIREYHWFEQVGWFRVCMSLGHSALPVPFWNVIPEIAGVFLESMTLSE